MRTAVTIAVAGAFGAVSRHYVESAVNRRVGDAFPWGTFVVNVSGSFALGLLVGLFARRFSVPLWLSAAQLVRNRATQVRNWGHAVKPIRTSATCDPLAVPTF